MCLVVGGLFWGFLFVWRKAVVVVVLLGLRLLLGFVVVFVLIHGMPVTKSFGGLLLHNYFNLVLKRQTKMANGTSIF